MTEAAAAVIDNGFAIDGMRLDRIEWNGAVGNVASARTARALGFQYEGVRRGAMLTPRGRVDAWVAGLLFHDARKRTPWPVLARQAATGAGWFPVVARPEATELAPWQERPSTP